MIIFTRLTVRDRLLELAFPSRRRKREQQLDQAMRYLMAHFEEPCWIEDFYHNLHLIPNGRGKNGFHCSNERSDQRA